MVNIRAATLIALMVASWPALAHPAGLNAEGCHNDRKNGTYHCHRAPAGGGARPAAQAAGAGFGPGGAGAPAAPRSGEGGAGYYPNCAAVRAAGKAPIRRGQPGYATPMDRDGDGIACECGSGRWAG